MQADAWVVEVRGKDASSLMVGLKTKKVRHSKKKMKDIYRTSTSSPKCSPSRKL